MACRATDLVHARRRADPALWRLKALTTFHDLGVIPEIADALEAEGIIEPFPIQSLAVPIGLSGHDIIGQARTGTGKTLGFGVPMLQRVVAADGGEKPQALVIVPTRELAIQVTADLVAAGGKLGSPGAGRSTAAVRTNRRSRPSRRVSRSSSARRAGCWTWPSRSTSTCRRWRSSSWTRPTRCSTWASCPTSSGWSTRCPRRGRRCCSRRPCRARSSRCPARTCTSPTHIRAESPTTRRRRHIEQYVFRAHRWTSPSCSPASCRPAAAA